MRSTPATAAAFLAAAPPMSSASSPRSVRRRRAILRSRRLRRRASLACLSSSSSDSSLLDPSPSFSLPSFSLPSSSPSSFGSPPRSSVSCSTIRCSASFARSISSYFRIFSRPALIFGSRSSVAIMSRPGSWLVHGLGIFDVPASAPSAPSAPSALPLSPTARSCSSRFVALATSSSTSSAKSGGKSTSARLRSSWRYRMRSVWTFMRRAAASSRSSWDIGSSIGRDLASRSMSASRVSSSAAARRPAPHRSLVSSSFTGSDGPSCSGSCVSSASALDAADGVSRPAAIW